MSRPVYPLLLLSLLVCPGIGACASNPASPVPPLLDPSHPAWKAPAPDQFRARFSTSKGEFLVLFQRDWAPIGVDRVFHLVQAGFFDDSRFFRVIENFIAQFGIPGDPAVAPAWRRLNIPDDPVAASNTRGRVAFAMTGPNTRTTQLFISLVDNSRLDADGFAPLGEIESGMEVVDRLYSGYGESAGGGMRRGNQERMFQAGNAHLDKDYPELDRIFRVEIVP